MSQPYNADTGAEQHHLPVTWTICPDGHRFGVQKPPGSQAACSRCRQEHGKTVLVIVGNAPEDNGSERPVKTGTAECRTCGATEPQRTDDRLPVGWVLLAVGADRSRVKNGSTRRRLGPYCSASCAAAGLHAAGAAAGARPGRRPDDRSEFASLMTQRPVGARRYGL